MQSTTTFEQRRRRVGLLFVLPALVVLAAVLGYPIVDSIVLALQRVQLTGGKVEQSWVGLANFQRLFADAVARWVDGAHDTEYQLTWPRFRGNVMHALQALTEHSAHTIWAFTSGGPIAVLANALMEAPAAQTFKLSWPLVNTGLTRLRLGQRGATLIKPFDQADVIAGQGTVGLEIAQDVARFGERLDSVLVPCSGGGLASGVALGLNGGAVVHTVEPANFDGMKRSLEAGRRVVAPGGTLSIADALMAPAPGELVFEIARERLGPGITVDDDAMRRAVAFAAARLKLVAEPGGAAALAALLVGAVPKQAVVLVLSGANA